MKYEPLKVIIAGSRDITQMAFVEKAILLSRFNIGEIVCGEARGPDTLGKEWAIKNGIPYKSMPAAWWVNGHYNKLAGFQRNEDMGDYADACIAVWDGVSGGTKHMIGYMKKLGKPCFVHKTDFVDLFDQFNSSDYWWGDK